MFGVCGFLQPVFYLHVATSVNKINVEVRYPRMTAYTIWWDPGRRKCYRYLPINQLLNKQLWHPYLSITANIDQLL